MTKLEICKRVRQESGSGGSGPSSTLNQTGEYQRIVSWVDTAYRNVQLASKGWDFLTKEFSFNLSIGDAGYTAADAGISDYSRWITDDWRIYLTDITTEQYIDYVPWHDFRISYMTGSSRTTTGKPSVFTIKPDQSLLFYPIPDAAYTCVGEYYASPDSMALDADSPIFPEEYHEIVVWGALEMFGAYEAEYDKHEVGAQNYGNLLVKLKNAHGPQPYWGSPLS